MVLNFNAVADSADSGKQRKEVIMDYQPIIVSEGVNITTPSTWPPPQDPKIKIIIDATKIQK